jgi:hypothetical protein
MNIGNTLTWSAYELILGDAKRSEVEACLIRSHDCTPEQASDAVTAAQNTFIKGIKVAKDRRTDLRCRTADVVKLKGAKQ